MYYNNTYCELLLFYTNMLCSSNESFHCVISSLVLPILCVLIMDQFLYPHWEETVIAFEKKLPIVQKRIMSISEGHREIARKGK